MSVKGYKVFDKDWNTKNKFHWTVGETYTHEGELEICGSGFHFCKRLSDLSRYISIFEMDHFMPGYVESHSIDTTINFTKVHIAEVEALGTVLDDEEKSVTDKIHIIREIPISELVDIMNIGKHNYGFNNTGENNIGNGNSGSYNIGHANAAIYCLGGFNTGNRNIGYHNTGHDNMGYFNVGIGNLGSYNNGMWCRGNHIPNGSLFCTNNDETFKFPNEIRVFNKVISATEINIDLVKMVTRPTSFEYITMLDDGTYQLRVTMLYPFYYELATLIDSVLSLTTWIPEDKMSDKEKEEHPYYSYTNGYLLVHEYEDMWKEFWEEPSTRRRQYVKNIIKALPGFDPVIFKEITGIDV